jgi:hypothetical protein
MRARPFSNASRYNYGNMPAWAEHNLSHFWQAADEHERANGATYREIEIALPRELVPEQRRDLVEDFIKKEIGENHAYQWAIHTPKAALEKGEQPKQLLNALNAQIDALSAASKATQRAAPTFEESARNATPVIERAVSVCRQGIAGSSLV